MYVKVVKLRVEILLVEKLSMYMTRRWGMNDDGKAKKKKTKCCYTNNWPKLSQPGVGHNGPEDRGEVAESHKGVVDGGGQVIVPEQEVLEVQHQNSWGQTEETETHS